MVKFDTNPFLVHKGPLGGVNLRTYKKSDSLTLSFSQIPECALVISVQNDDFPPYHIKFYSSFVWVSKAWSKLTSKVTFFDSFGLSSFLKSTSIESISDKKPSLSSHHPLMDGYFPFNYNLSAIKVIHQTSIHFYGKEYKFQRKRIKKYKIKSINKKNLFFL